MNLRSLPLAYDHPTWWLNLMWRPSGYPVTGNEWLTDIDKYVTIPDSGNRILGKSRAEASALDLPPLECYETEV